MENHTRKEIAAGVFVIAGILALAYLSVRLGDLSIVPKGEVHLTARFASIGDLKPGASVRVAGVSVGKVVTAELDGFTAVVKLGLEPNLELPDDTIASIRTAGLLGESFVSLSPGASNQHLQDGDRISQTEAPVDLVELISKYAFKTNDTLGDEP